MRQCATVAGSASSYAHSARLRPRDCTSETSDVPVAIEMVLERVCDRESRLRRLAKKVSKTCFEKARLDIASDHGLHMSETNINFERIIEMAVTNIMIVGVGVKSTLLTSCILGGLAETAGYDVKLSEQLTEWHSVEWPVVTYVRYATEGEAVTEPIVEEGCADVLIAFERLEALRYAHFLKKDGALIVNDQRIDPMPVITV